MADIYHHVIQLQQQVQLPHVCRVSVSKRLPLNLVATGDAWGVLFR